MTNKQLSCWLKDRKTYDLLYSAAEAERRAGDDRFIAVLASATNNAADSVGPESHPEFWSIALGSIHDAIAANYSVRELSPWFAKHGFIC